MSGAKGATASLSIAILLVCRNRRETTLSALRQVACQDAGIDRTIYLFDDASTDGTPDAVAAEFPEVRVLQGDGNAFWNGGLHKVWSAALDAPVDAYLWLNDDVDLKDDAFARLADGWRTMEARQGNRLFILVGATHGDDGEITYAGMRSTSKRTSFRLSYARPRADLEPIDTFNGNIVLVPHAVVDRIGINDGHFFHNFGDFDYGLRATAAGIRVMLLPGTLGHCAGNPAKSRRGYGSPELSLAEQWRKVNTHHGLPFASWWRLTRRHSGAWWPLHFLIPYRWLLIPRRLRARGRG